MNGIQNAFAISKHGGIAAILFAVILVFAGFASADPMSSSHSHKAKKGYFTITESTEVGGITLPAGDYKAREVNTPSGPAVEFVHLFFNYLAQDIVQGSQEEVVGRVSSTEETLDTLPKHTRLILNSRTGEATALEIRGDAVRYELAPSQMAGQ